MPRRPLILPVAALLFAVPARSEPIGNPGIIALHTAGLSAEAIAAKVRHAPCDYDLSTSGLIALKRAGVPQAAIVAMLEHCGGASDGNAPAANRPPGIFLQSPSGGQTLRPAAMSSIKIVGNGSILFPTMARLIVPQPTAPVVAGPRPVFLFRFAPPPPGTARSDFGQAAPEGAQSPNEFSLVHFRVDSGNRQVTIGRVQPYVEISGIDPKNTVPFAIADLGQGAFRVELQHDLEPGQYGFVLIGERERRRGTLFRIYDFAVTSASR